MPPASSAELGPAGLPTYGSNSHGEAGDDAVALGPAARGRSVLAASLVVTAVVASAALFSAGWRTGRAASAPVLDAQAKAAAAASGDEWDGSTIIQGASDYRAYRLVRLSNSLQALLVSNPQSEVAAAAMDVGVGHWDDPLDIPGLAHFTEHMLFLGSEKYPEESSYNAFLSEHGGAGNAYTDSEDTNFYFSVQSGALQEALDRFAGFFAAPLMHEDSAQREMHAVDSEHRKNLQDDYWRQSRVLETVSDPSHPFHKWGTGDLSTLNRTDIRPRLLAFHARHYAASRMRLVVEGKQDLETLQQWVVGSFGGVPAEPLAVEACVDATLGKSRVVFDAMVAACRRDSQRLDCVGDTRRLWGEYCSAAPGRQRDGGSGAAEHSAQREEVRQCVETSLAEDSAKFERLVRECQQELPEVRDCEADTLQMWVEYCEEQVSGQWEAEKAPLPPVPSADDGSDDDAVGSGGAGAAPAAAAATTTTTTTTTTTAGAGATTTTTTVTVLPTVTTTTTTTTAGGDGVTAAITTIPTVTTTTTTASAGRRRRRRRRRRQRRRRMGELPATTDGTPSVASSAAADAGATRPVDGGARVRLSAALQEAATERGEPGRCPALYVGPPLGRLGRAVKARSGCTLQESMGDCESHYATGDHFREEPGGPMSIKLHACRWDRAADACNGGPECYLPDGRRMPEALAAALAEAEAEEGAEGAPLGVANATAADSDAFEAFMRGVEACVAAAVATSGAHFQAMLQACREKGGGLQPWQADCEAVTRRLFVEACESQTAAALPPAAGALGAPAGPFPPHLRQRFVRLAPVDDSETLDMVWQLPGMSASQHVRRADPCGYIAYLLGHEGRGSTLSALRDQKLAVGLSAGLRDAPRQGDWSLFSVTITLTSRGVERLDDVVRLVFRALHVLRADGALSLSPPSRNKNRNVTGWAEMQALDDLGFQFAPAQPPAQDASDLAGRLQVVDAAADVMNPPSRAVFDPALVRMALDVLCEPTQLAVLTLSSPIFRVDPAAAAGAAFLAENKLKPGWTELPSGLQFKVLRAGDGAAHPAVNAPCECHYRGTLVDGTEFDSSYRRGKPTTFAPNEVIEGWTEAMQLMVEGDKWQLAIPSDLAYGAGGSPPQVPGNSALLFTIEILKIDGDTVPVASGSALHGVAALVAAAEASARREGDPEGVKGALLNNTGTGAGTAACEEKDGETWCETEPGVWARQSDGCVFKEELGAVYCKGPDGEWRQETAEAEERVTTAAVAVAGAAAEASTGRVDNVTAGTAAGVSAVVMTTEQAAAGAAAVATTERVAGATANATAGAGGEEAAGAEAEQATDEALLAVSVSAATPAASTASAPRDEFALLLDQLHGPADDEATEGHGAAGSGPSATSASHTGEAARMAAASRRRRRRLGTRGAVPAAGAVRRRLVGASSDRIAALHRQNGDAAAAAPRIAAALPDDDGTAAPAAARREPDYPRLTARRGSASSESRSSTCPTCPGSSAAEPLPLLEPIYGTRYSNDLIPAATLASWKLTSGGVPPGDGAMAEAAALLAEVALPASNEYIPSVDTLEATMAEFRQHVSPPLITAIIEAQPQLLRNDSAVELWWSPDVTFYKPRVDHVCRLWTAAAYDTPNASALTSMLERVADDALHEEAYTASLAGYGTSLSHSEAGLDLRWQGWADPQALVRFMTTQLAATFGALSPADGADEGGAEGGAAAVRQVLPGGVERARSHWSQLLETRLKGLRSFDQEPPWSHALYVAELLAEAHNFDAAEIVAATKPLTFEQTLAVADRFTGRAPGGPRRLTCLVHGTVTPDTALHLVDVVAGHLGLLRPEAAPADGAEPWPLLPPPPKTTQIDAGGGVTLRMRSFNGDEVNSASLVLMQVGRRDVLAEGLDAYGALKREQALALVAAAIESPAYAQLRTEEQLGYIVWSFSQWTHAVQGMALVVESSRYLPDQLHLRIEAFLQSFRDTLAATTAEQFAADVEALQGSLLSRPTSLGHATDRWWAEIVSGDYLFDRAAAAVEAAASLDLDDVLAFYDAYLMPAGEHHRELAVEVFSGVSTQQLDPSALPDLSDSATVLDLGGGQAALQVGELRAFRATQGIFP